MSNTNFDDVALPEFTETEVLDASKIKKLKATGDNDIYKWRINATTRDVSNPETSASGWMMLVIEALALRPDADGNFSEPTSIKTKKWIMLPRTPPKAILLQKGYPEDLADKVLAEFNPNGKSDFAINSFKKFAKAIFPEAFPKKPHWSKEVGGIVEYDPETGEAVNIGNDEPAKEKVALATQNEIRIAKTIAGNLWANPSQCDGKEFYDGYGYEVKNGKTSDFGSLNGWPSATIPNKKSAPFGTVDPREVLDPTKSQGK